MYGREASLPTQTISSPVLTRFYPKVTVMFCYLENFNGHLNLPANDINEDPQYRGDDIHETMALLYCLHTLYSTWDFILMTKFQYIDKLESTSGTYLCSAGALRKCRRVEDQVSEISQFAYQILHSSIGVFFFEKKKICFFFCLCVGVYIYVCMCVGV